MNTDPKTLEALKAAHMVLAQLVNPDMKVSAQHIYFHAVEAEAKVRAAIGGPLKSVQDGG